MAKKKIKGKKLEKETSGEQSGKKSKRPSVKERFQTQIQQLEQDLEDADGNLQQHKEAIRQARDLYDTEVDSKEACVSYLKRVLKAENDSRLEIQEKLQTERDIAELMKKRATTKSDAAERSSEVANSLFKQQKMELEGKLSLLEELRLERNSQQAHLKRVEDALEEKTEAKRQKAREADASHVDKLLRNREKFIEMCKKLKEEWMRTFKLRLPVHAKKHLEENIRLREICDTATKELLQLQDKSRALKNLQKSLDLEEEVQSASKENAEKKEADQQKRLKHLIQTYNNLQPNSELRMEDVSESSVLKNFHFFVPNDEQEQNSHLQEMAEVENEIEQKLVTIREREIEICRILDKRYDLNAILRDQTEYKAFIENELEENIDKNGVLMSTVLRSGKVFQTRYGKKVELDLDYDVLHQIRQLLDLASEKVSARKQNARMYN